MEILPLILLNIGFASLDENWNWKRVNSPFTRLYYMNEGRAGIRFLSGIHEMKPSHLYFIPPFTPFDCIGEQSFSQYYIHIYENHFPSISILEELNIPFEIKANELDILLIKRLMEINPQRELKQYDPDIYDNPPTLLKNIAEDIRQAQYVCLETRSILNQLISRFLRHSTIKTETSDLRIKKVIAFIRNNIYSTIKIIQLAEICSLSTDHFIRLFKKETGWTPISYINQKKIEKAQQMLLIENFSIKEVAYRLSFQNVSHFNRVFKQFTSLTPSEYNQLNRQ